MSKDIRSFFTSGPKKTTLPPTPVIKRKALHISSDEEDAIPETPKVKKSKTVFKDDTTKNRRIVDQKDDRTIISSSSTPKPKASLSKLKKNVFEKKPMKEIDASSMFGGEPKRVERKKLSAKKSLAADESINFDDDDFEASMVVLDEDALVKNSIEGKKKHKSPKESSKSVSNGYEQKTEKKTAPKTETKTTPKTETKTTPKTEKKADDSDLTIKDSPKTTPKSKNQRKQDLETSVLSDEERFERKRMSAMLYQKYKNRSTAALNPGSKEVPKGKPNCLAGLTFLVSGILQSLERDEANSYIKDLGGKVSTTVGKRLNYLVVGEDAGPKKLADAEHLGIKILTEDDLFNIVREKSGQRIIKNNDSNKNISPDLASPKKIKKEESVKKQSSSEKRKIKEEKLTPVKRKNIDSNGSVPVLEKKPLIKKEIQDKENLKNVKNEIVKKSKIVDSDMQAWVDKYKPESIKQIIGQQGAASNCVKLLNWLTKWYTNHDGKKKLQKPNPWAKNDDGSFYKAALLSGPPGVGKTTTATLVCKELGFDTVEFNASDTRSKRLLKEEVSELLSNKTLYGYFHDNAQTVTKKHVLIMDEVDGMAGNEDRGGIQELIALIKDSSVPIICMCNDRNHQKMRSLVNYCYDLRFNKPRLEQIKGPIMSICFKENFKVPPAKIEEIIAATNNDIRQTLNHLSLLSAGKELNLQLNENNAEKTASKDLKIGPWEVVRRVFSSEEHKHMTLNDKSDLFFNDYSMAPLFVQQNYLCVTPKVSKKEIPERVALTADSLSLGDLIDKRIRSNSAWSLLPTQAMFSSVMPGEYMAGHVTGQINFPGWLGKYSKSNKRSRLAQEIHDHTRTCTSGSRLSVRMDYAPFLLKAIVNPLKAKGADGVSEALNVMKEYRLLREDIDALIELTSWPGRKNPMESIDGKVKAALTRAYNKEVLAYSYSAAVGVKKKKLAEQEDNLESMQIDEEEGSKNAAAVSDEDEDDNLENDALIKAKKAPAAKPTTSKKPSTSKPKAGTSRNKK